MLQQVTRSAIIGRTTVFSSKRVHWPAKRFRSSTTRGEPGAATNIRESPSSSGEASQINQSRSTDGQLRESKSTTARPVSNPEQSGLGAQEEPQASQENMKRPPEEPDHVKRSYVEKEGQKPLDPADHGFGAAKDAK
ncbi:hypothetical protein PRZ48_003302 [Zasmidium cellare]|uniref:Uncharacterized protein n=1 Tax=Zasmidium cellare TaxID=395010 RepID=A0ABR0EUN9_ZASCE|nr:hypothetical protein PRZ48_003302 [Zasmidium cellare]